MSNPSDVPPQQPGAQPPASGNVPPAGPQQPPTNPPSTPEYQAPPPGYQAPPPGYQAPPPGYQAPPPGYQAPPPAYQGQPASTGGFRFEMPTDRPRNFSDALPVGGLSGMFKVAAMPTELKVSYWIWLIGGLLGLLGGIIGLFGSFVLIAFAPAIGFLVLLLVIVALALATAQIILAMKMKEGREWARFALTILVGISLVLTVLSASLADGRAGGNLPGFIISLVATVLMWLPNAQAWFVANRGRF
ncbi:hypothetical protein [Arthrobacter sp. ov407]|uniref:hypothetical protein n=1 Tax=Arthrobacter sp. ov407 TaxID=1761748 RepID=UPI000B88B5FD|nr:hypothetical protein [Arthrobacter sp. ov407]